MKRASLIVSIYIALVTLFSCSSQQNNNNKNQALFTYVNPFIGTGGHGHTYPGASSPFGAVQLSPDTRLEGWDGCGGYHYSDSVIYGFSHTHLSGTGVSDYGDILLMPAIGSPTFDNGYKTSPDAGYASRFSHDKEKAEAGYYQVFLEDYNIDVELTTTTRAGFHKYSFHQTGDAYIVLDLQHRDELLDHQIEIIDNKIIQGKRISKAWAEQQFVFFYGELSETIRNVEYNVDSTKAILHIEPNEEVFLKIGLSATGIEGAKKNLTTEIPNWDFEQVKQNTQKTWNSELSKIEIEALGEDDKEIFYTSLYHSYLNPNTFQDVDGKYRGMDKQVHTAKDFTNYTIFSLWDTYRGTHPLYTITQQERTNDFIKTFLNQYEKGGKLPVWELAGNYTGCMIGYHSIPVIVDAYQKGITDFDAELALEAIIKTATEEDLGKEHYIEKGYMASDEEHESVSKNLEYAYNDWCIAQFAKSLGKHKVYEEYLKRAQNYKNIYEPSTGFMRAKRNQQFTEPFNPSEVNFNYTEANSWQYSFYVPQDVSGLINLFGGPDKYEEKLDLLFSTSSEAAGRKQADITGLIGQYAHGNEPSHHMAYMYNFIGKHWKTQEKIRRLLDEMYSTQPDGLIGNEDCGQMSSWYVLSALGFYPVTPGSQDYIIGSPNVKSASIHLENGKTFKIRVLNPSKENIYIQSIKLNGNEHNQSYISHKAINQGGELIFEMGAKPNKEWEHKSPISEIKSHLITPVPYVKTEDQVFFETLKLELACVDKEASIYYTLDGSEPTESSNLYQDVIVIDESKTLKAIALVEGKSASKVIEGHFFKVNQKRKVTYKTLYDSQYPGGGQKGLIDYIRGGDDFRTGAWQGWQGHDVEIVVELDKEEMVSKLSSGYIQDIKSWIFMPKSVRYYISTDGENYELAGEVKNKIDDKKYGQIVDEFSISLKAKKVKYVKVIAENYGIIPDWHLGAGGKSWCFMDEIIIE